MKYIQNPYRGTGIEDLVEIVPLPSTDKSAVAKLLQHCPAHAQTPLVNASELAFEVGIEHLFVKDERTRMGLGSFKALGAAYVIACDADSVGGELSSALEGQTYVTASAGNHGLSVAAGAKVFGAKSVIYLSKTVPDSFAKRLEAQDVQVIVEGEDYEASMHAAMNAAEANNWRLLSDSSWQGYTIVPHRLMEGYLQMAAEAFDQMPKPPTNIILQAGVGGMAAAVAATARKTFGDAPKIIIVEPEAAPALYQSIEKGEAILTSGPISNMGRLDCKEPSLIALNGLSRDADYFALISEDEGDASMELLADHKLKTTPSGGAGISFLVACENKEAVGIHDNSTILAFMTEAQDQ